MNKSHAVPLELDAVETTTPDGRSPGEVPGEGFGAAYLAPGCMGTWSSHRFAALHESESGP
jgi:hypothetical protein